MDIWNDILLGASARVVTPFSDAFAGFPAFAAALKAQTCSRQMTTNTNVPRPGKNTCSAFVLDGGLNGAYDRSLYQSSDMINSELVAVMDNQVAFNASRTIGSAGLEDIIHATEDAVLCSLFAHCDELAFGSEKADNGAPVPTVSYDDNNSYSSSYVHPFAGEPSGGNRPSTVLMCRKLDAFTCGQLIALAEHRAVVKAHIWGMDPFVREVGSSLRMYRSDLLKDELQMLFIDNKKR